MIKTRYTVIRIVCVHTECALTAIRIECTFSQSTSIGYLKVNCIITWNNAGVIFLRVIGYMKKPAIRQEITSVTLLLPLGKLLYLLCQCVTRLCTRCDLVALCCRPHWVVYSIWVQSSCCYCITKTIERSFTAVQLHYRILDNKPRDKYSYYHMPTQYTVICIIRNRIHFSNRSVNGANAN